MASHCGHRTGTPCTGTRTRGRVLPPCSLVAVQYYSPGANRCHHEHLLCDIHVKRSAAAARRGTAHSVADTQMAPPEAECGARFCAPVVGEGRACRRAACCRRRFRSRAAPHPHLRKASGELSGPHTKHGRTPAGDRLRGAIRGVSAAGRGGARGCGCRAQTCPPRSTRPCSEK